jgi:hypothetical protein
VTALPGRAHVNVWVSMNAYAAYAGITPEVEGSGLVAPEGTMLVREVLDDASGSGSRIVHPPPGTSSSAASAAHPRSLEIDRIPTG